MKNLYYTRVLIGCILTLFFCSSSFSQVNQEWVARYSGPVSFPGDDEGYSIVTDASGNVYVTGVSAGSGSYGDYLTIKYNSAGTVQWTARYNGNGNSSDFAESIALDTSCNVYVTGSSYIVGTESDYATIKYNSNGVQQWVARYNGLGNQGYSYDYAESIAVDGNGNVYVTGESRNKTNSDYTTIKYNSSGIQMWVARYNGTGDSSDIASSIVLDGSGNIYVTGASYGIGSVRDYTTIKYNDAGVQQWAARYNGSGNDDDYATSITADNSGNVYITGKVTGNGTREDICTIKYNSAGVQQWITSYNGTGNTIEWANSMEIDSEENVYVAGPSVDSSGSNVKGVIIKYNSSGVQKWAAHYNDAYPFSITVDRLQNVYATGLGLDSSLTHSDYITVKYSQSGNLAWIVRYNGPGNYDDYANSIALDTSGNVFVTGLSHGGSITGFDYATIKYSQTTGIVQTFSGVPEKFILLQNYPNPFNPSTKINYELRVTSYAKLVVYDIMGREITTLVNEKKSPGTYQVEFDARLGWQGSGLPSGVYFYKLEAGDYTDTKRMLLV